MNETMYLYLGASLVIGLIIGFIMARILTPSQRKNKALQKELSDTKQKLETQQQEITQHFAQTANLFEDLGQSYSKIYQHMQASSVKLMSDRPMQDNPFLENKTSKTVLEPTTSKEDNRQQEAMQKQDDLIKEEASKQSESIDVDAPAKDYAPGKSDALKA